MSWILYDAPLVCSLASKFALAELAKPYELIVLNLADGGSHTPQYLRINPKGRVPALATWAGMPTENMAILSFLSDMSPEAGLLAAEPWSRAEAISWLAWLSNTVHSAYTRVIRPKRFTDAPEGAAAIRDSAVAGLAEALGRADAQLAGREYLLDRLSICDLYLLVFALWRRSPALPHPGPNAWSPASPACRRSRLPHAGTRCRTRSRSPSSSRSMPPTSPWRRGSTPPAPRLSPASSGRPECASSRRCPRSTLNKVAKAALRARLAAEQDASALPKGERR